MWADAAEDCEQTELRLACTAQLAQRLVAKAPGSLALASGIADAAQLEGCSKITLLLLLGLVTGVGRQLIPSEQLTAYKGPSRDIVTAAQQQAANPGSFEWRIEQFSQQPEQPGQKVQSPWFEAGGREWCIRAYPHGQNAEVAGHVSGGFCCLQCVHVVHQACMQRLHAALYCSWDLADAFFATPSCAAVFVIAKEGSAPATGMLTICDQGAPQPQHETRSFEHEVPTSGWGFPKFISLEELRSRPGYLADDTLVIRAEVHALL